MSMIREATVLSDSFGHIKFVDRLKGYKHVQCIQHRQSAVIYNIPWKPTTYISIRP